jgi:trehalose-phosphatase
LSELLYHGTKSRFEIWGSHGREHLKRSGEYHLYHLGSSDQDTLQQLESEITDMGLAETIEAKPASIAFHWRGAELPQQRRIQSAVEKIYSRHSTGSSLELLTFDGGLEVRSRERTKGVVINDVLHHEEANIPAAYLGDDLTDEDAFAALNDKGLSILVRTEPRASSAQYWLRPPNELLKFLDDWIASCGKQEPLASYSAGTQSKDRENDR